MASACARSRGSRGVGRGRPRGAWRGGVRAEGRCARAGRRPEPGVRGRAALGSARKEREEERRERERKRKGKKKGKGKRKERERERKRERRRRRSRRAVARGRRAAERRVMRRWRGKRGRVRAAEKRKDGTTIEIGCQDNGNSEKGLGFRVN